MSTEMRKAAMALMGLTEQDRVWILDRLPEAERAELERLVGELHALGFQPQALADSSALDNILSLHDKACPAAGDDDMYRKLDAFPRHVWKDWAQEEAEWLVAQVLLMRKWSWSDTVLQNLQPEKTDRILRLRKELTPFSERLSAQFLQRLSQVLDIRLVCLADKPAYIGVSVQPVSQKNGLTAWLRSFVRRA